MINTILKRIKSSLVGEGLIEIMLTLLLIGVGVVALMRFQNYLAYSNSVSKQQSEASLLALSQIESLRDYQVLNTLSGYYAYQDIDTGSSTATGTDASYALSWTVTPYTNPTYKTIDISVSWTDRRGDSQSTRLITHVARIDPATEADIK